MPRTTSTSNRLFCFVPNKKGRQPGQPTDRDHPLLLLRLPNHQVPAAAPLQQQDLHARPHPQPLPAQPRRLRPRLLRRLVRLRTAHVPLLQREVLRLRRHRQGRHHLLPDHAR